MYGYVLTPKGEHYLATAVSQLTGYAFTRDITAAQVVIAIQYLEEVLTELGRYDGS